MYGTSIYDCAFLITGECSGMTDKADSGTSGKFPEFPNEDPTKPELDRFFRVFDDKLKLTEYMSPWSRGLMDCATIFDRVVGAH